MDSTTHQGAVGQRLWEQYRRDYEEAQRRIRRGLIITMTLLLIASIAMVTCAFVVQ